MNDFTELERRLAAALDRIGQGIASLGAAAPAAAPAGEGAQEDVAALQAALDDERTANAQLTERVRAIRDSHPTRGAALEGNLAPPPEATDAQGRELQRQKLLNEHLTDTNRALNTAAEQGLTEPNLINEAMQSELESLRAQRQAEIAEMDEILSELKPLIGEVA